MTKARTHNIALTFSRPVTDKVARAYLADVMKAVAAFQTLGKAAWDYDHTPKIVKTVVRRK